MEKTTLDVKPMVMTTIVEDYYLSKYDIAKLDVGEVVELLTKDGREIRLHNEDAIDLSQELIDAGLSAMDSYDQAWSE